MRREELTQFECHLCGEGNILDHFQKCSMIIQAESTQIFRDIHSGPKYSFRSLPHQAQAPTSRVAWLPVCGPLPPLCQIGGVLNFASSCFYNVFLFSWRSLISLEWIFPGGSWPRFLKPGFDLIFFFCNTLPYLFASPDNLFFSATSCLPGETGHRKRRPNLLAFDPARPICGRHQGSGTTTRGRR